MKRLLCLLWLGSLVVGCAGADGENTETGLSGSEYGVGPPGRWGGGEEGGGVPDEGGGGTPGSEAGEGSAEGGGVPDVPGESYKGYPSNELGIVILGPSAENSVSLQNGTIQLSGVLFDEATSIHVSCTCGDVDATVGTFWNSPPLALLEGDNFIEVTATNAAGDTATDSLFVTYTPLFEFDGLPEARPSSLWVNEPATLFFSMRITTYSNFNKQTVTLVQVDPVGNPLAEWHMSDDGNFVGASGDEIPLDGVYTAKLVVTHPTEQSLRFRVRVHVDLGNGDSYFAWSGSRIVDAVKRLDFHDCQLFKASIVSAQDAYNQAAAGVAPSAGQEAALVKLSNDPLVLVSGPSPEGFGAWAYYSSGVLGVVYGNEAGTRGSPGMDGILETTSEPLTTGVRILSRKAQLMSPYAAEFAGVDETDSIASTLEDVDCPPFDVHKSIHGDANLGAMQRLSEAGVVSLVTHGTMAFTDLDQSVKEKNRWEHEGSQVVLGSGEVVSCENLETGVTACSSDNPVGCGSGQSCIYTDVTGTVSSGYCLDNTQVDLLMGRVAIGGDGNYAVLPSFFRHHATSRIFPESLVYLGTCFGLWNGSLAGELYAAGAKGIAGFTGTVSSVFAQERGADFFSTMISQGLHTGTALAPLEDPAYPGTWFRFVGATNLDVNDASIINEGFETADTTGWSVSGDGRVTSQLASSSTVDGKFMGILSTGLGYTQQVGELAQEFCIPADRTQFSFWWKFYSEEFIEWCGSGYQDAFETTLESDGQLLTAIQAEVDDLCPPEECSGCGDGYETLDPSDVSFDQGDVWNTEWRKAVVDISEMSGSGKPVNLRFFTTDVGDSIYDTVILIDAITLE